MTGRCEFLEFLRAEILAVCEDETAADRIEREVRLAFGSERVYVPALPDSRRDEALRLMRSGMTPEQAARRVGVHVTTTYRWRKSVRRKPADAGLGRGNWVL